MQIVDARFAMNVKVTTFTNPFSFFCIVDGFSIDNTTFENNVDTGNGAPKKSICDVNHGQYVAVMWKNKWTRGVITMESMFLIWLVDYGIFIQPDDKTVYTELPAEYRKLPTKVFEAAIHGVTPLDKYISDDCQILNKMSTIWNKASVERCQKLLESASKVYFMPFLLLSTKSNDIVLGDLYLELSGSKCVNIIDELELWPVFLEKNKENYIANLSKYYITRRKHRACILKPSFPEVKLPEVTIEMTLKEYTALSEGIPDLAQLLDLDAYTDSDNDFETEVDLKKNRDAYKLSPEEIEKYSEMFVNINGSDYNVLNILVNKARDLSMCERYKDHDIKSIGRGTACRRSSFE